MKQVTVFVDGGPVEGFNIDCGSWCVGSSGELLIYNDDAAPGQTVKFGWGLPPLHVPPRPPSLKIVYARGKWSCAKEAEQ